MAHQSLYRMYRPTTFDDVVGQEQVTRPLHEAVKAKKVGHAYLFAGSRGLGKTSVARIFAREVGCHDYDLTEIDAASNNSVEDIRALAEGVYTLPLQSPYKVYILDEVHMLSKGAWNAFLKTLEEPPAHAIFILATTELEKVPETVQSRCQVFEFKKPSRETLAQVVAHVAKKEGVTIKQDAAELVALLAEGSYRDALSILQKVLGEAHGKELTREAVEAATGAPKREQVHALMSALSSGDRDAALTVIERARANQVDLRLFLELLLEALRTTLLIRLAPSLHPELERELGAEEFAALKRVGSSASHIGPETLLAFLSAADRVRYAPEPALPLLLAVLELYPI